MFKAATRYLRPENRHHIFGRVVGWPSPGDFWDGRPAYHATAEVGIYVKDGYRGGERRRVRGSRSHRRARER